MTSQGMENHRTQRNKDDVTYFGSQVREDTSYNDRIRDQTLRCAQYQLLHQNREKPGAFGHTNTNHDDKYQT